MLKRITINGYKSLRNIDVELGRLTVLFGPNASGKSNFIDGLQLLSRIASSRTLSDAMSEPLRGYPVEQFSFPSGGLASLLSQKTAEFSFQVDIETGQPVNRYLYRVKICIRPESGSLSVGDEYLAWLNKKGEVLVVNQRGTSWSLPKGHIDFGEDALTAAKREIYEEAGITDLKIIKELGLIK